MKEQNKTYPFVDREASGYESLQDFSDAEFLYLTNSSDTEEGEDST